MDIQLIVPNPPCFVGQTHPGYLGVFAYDMHKNMSAPQQIKHLYNNKYYLCIEILSKPHQFRNYFYQLCQVETVQFVLPCPQNALNPGDCLEGCFFFYLNDEQRNDFFEKTFGKTKGFITQKVTPIALSEDPSDPNPIVYQRSVNLAIRDENKWSQWLITVKHLGSDERRLKSPLNED